MRIPRFFLAAIGALGLGNLHGLSPQEIKELDPQRPRFSWRRPLTARRLARKSISQLAKLARRIGRGRNVGCSWRDIAAELRRRCVAVAA